MKTIITAAALLAQATAQDVEVLSTAAAQAKVEAQDVMMAEKEAFWEEQRAQGLFSQDRSSSNDGIRCRNGFAGEYPCKGVDFVSFITHADLGSTSREGSDVWGWTDPEDGAEYAMIGQTDGTAFARITEDGDIVYLGRVNSSGGVVSAWKDIKVYQNHAYIVQDTRSGTPGTEFIGLGVFDLTRLRALDGSDPQVLELDTLYQDEGHTSSHNIIINEESGYAYSVGGETFLGGPHIVDIRDPKNPTYVVGFDGDGYTHDAQCVNYKGPDQDYVGREVCACYNTDTLTFLDVTDKDNITIISRNPYEGAGYTHQGWWTEDYRHLLLDDERDERNDVAAGNEGFTVTYVWNVEDLDNPSVIGVYRSAVTSIDHNLYIRDGLAYQANYAAGLRITSLDRVDEGILEEVAFFDCRPEDDQVAFVGTWSVYPYWNSRYIGLNSIERGFFILKLADSDSDTDSDSDSDSDSDTD